MSKSERTLDPGYVGLLGDRVASLERENRGLRDQLAALVASYEANTYAGNHAKQERERLARKQRNARVNALGPVEYVAELEAMRAVDRPTLHTQPSRAVELAREADKATRAKLFALTTDTCAAAIAWALFTPPARSMVFIPSGKACEVLVRDVRVSEEQAEAALAVGLPIEYRRVRNALDDQPHVPGLQYHSASGWSEVLPRAAVDLWRRLSPSFDAVIKRGTVQVRELSEDESRAVDRAAWERAGSKRVELPKLA